MREPNKPSLASSWRWFTPPINSNTGSQVCETACGDIWLHALYTFWSFKHDSSFIQQIIHTVFFFFLPAKLSADQIIGVLEGVGPYPCANLRDHSVPVHHCAFFPVTVLLRDNTLRSLEQKYKALVHKVTIIERYSSQLRWEKMMMLREINCCRGKISQELFPLPLQVYQSVRCGANVLKLLYSFQKNSQNLLRTATDHAYANVQAAVTQFENADKHFQAQGSSQTPPLKRRPMGA